MLETKRLPKIDNEAKQGPRNPEDQSTFSIEEQIHMEFASWAEAQLAELLGEEKSAEPDPANVFEVFSEDQVEVLQQFADKMIEKAASTAKTQVPLQKTRTSNTRGYVPPKDAKPIGNKQREREAQLKARIQPKNTFLDELDRMDREFDPED